jgi:hypothetical protein
MQQICEKMDMIDLDEDTINAEVLDSLGVTMDNFHRTYSSQGLLARLSTRRVQEHQEAALAVHRAVAMRPLLMTCRTITYTCNKLNALVTLMEYQSSHPHAVWLHRHCLLLRLRKLTRI